MKRNLQILKIFTLALIFVMTTAVVNAATRTANTTGPWSSTVTWSGQPVPTSADDVIINNGIIVTVDVAAQCNTITFASASGTITVNTGITLDVTLGITLQNAAAASRGATLAGAGTINCASVVVGGNITAVTSDQSTILTSTVANLTVSGNVNINSEDAGASENLATFSHSSGTVTVGGTITLDSDTDDNDGVATYSMDLGLDNGILVVTAASPFATNGIGTETFDFDGVTGGNSTTVNYAGGAQTALATSYRNIILSGSGTKTTTSVSVLGKLTMQGTAAAGNAISYSTAVLEYNGSAAQATTNNEFPAAGTGIDEVIINNVNGVTLNGGKTLNGNLTLTAGVLAAGTNLTMGSTGTPLITRSEGSITGTLQGTNDYDVTYTGNSKTTGPELGTTGLADILVNLTAGQTLTLDQNRTPDGTLTINGGTFDIGSFTINRSAASAALTIGAGDALKIGGTNSLPTNYTYAFNAASTVEYAGANQSIGATTYGHLVTSGSGTKTMSGATTVAGNATIGEGTTLNEAAIQMTLASGSVVTVNGTLDFSNSTGSIRTGNNVPATVTMGSTGLIRTVDPLGLGFVASASFQPQGTGTWTSTSINTNGTVEYYAGVAQAVDDRNFNNLTISTTAGTKTMTLTATTRTINGNLTISANAPFTFGGAARTINLKGDWVRNSTGTYTQGTNTINFNGTASQSIGGTVATTTFSNITIDNSSTGVVLNQQPFISGVMTFVDGIVFSFFPNILTYNDGATAVGASDASFVDGPVTKVGNDAFRFPIGADGFGYHYSEISAPTDPNFAFSSQYIRASGTGLGPNTAPGLVNVSNCEYWFLNRNVGNSTPDITLSWTAQSPCNAIPYITNFNALTIASFDFNTNEWNIQGATTRTGNNTAGTVQFTGVPDAVFNMSQTRITLGNTLVGANPLPVKFSDIKAYEKQSGIQIDWTAYQEVNLNNYVIERSADGHSFTSIGAVAARNLEVEPKYGFFDPAPLAGVSYYRIKNVDFDGKSGFSNIVRVNLDKNVKEITLYPNPVRNGYVSFQSSDLAKGNYTVKIFTAGGQEVYNLRIHHTGGAINQTIQLPASVKTGMYSMQLENDGVKVMSKAFIVQ